MAHASTSGVAMREYARSFIGPRSRKKCGHLFRVFFILVLLEIKIE